MGKSIYQITEDFYALMQEIEEYAENNDGEISPELEDAILSSKEDVEVKARNLFYYNRKLEMDLRYIEEEIQRLKYKSESLEKIQKNISKYAAILLSNFGKANKSGNKEYITADFKIAERKSKKVEYDTTLEERLTDSVLRGKLDEYTLNKLSEVATFDIKVKSDLTKVKETVDFISNTDSEVQTTLKLSKTALKPYAAGEVEDKVIKEFVNPYIVENININFK